jgi:hypothetical protein
LAQEQQQQQQRHAGRSQEEKKLVHAKVIASLKRGAARTMREHPAASAASSVAASDILAQLDPSQRQATHLVTAPAALASASARLAKAMNSRFDADQRATRRTIAQNKERLQAELKELEADRRRMMRDPEEMSRICAAYGSTVSSDFQTMLERNHLAPTGKSEEAARTSGSDSGEGPRGSKMSAQDIQESKDGEIARMAASRATRAARSRPWRANADSLDKARQQSGGRYVPPDRRGEDSALAFSRSDRARLGAIEQAGAARAGEALQAVEEVAADKRRDTRRIRQKIQRLRRGGKGKTRAEAEAEDDEHTEALDQAQQLLDGGSESAGTSGGGGGGSSAPLQDGEMVEAACAVARVLSSLGVDQQSGTTLDGALSKLERWGVLPSRSGADEKRATIAAPLHIDGFVASRALQAAGDLSNNRRVLQRATASLSMAAIQREQRFAEEPQVSDAAAKAIGRDMKGGGVPYAMAGREAGLSAGPVAEGRKLGLSLPEILLLARCVKHRQQRRVLDAADDAIRKRHAEERAEESRKRMAAAREALTSARLASQSDLQAKSLDPILRIGATAGQMGTTEDAIDDLVEAWNQRELPGGKASTNEAVAAAVRAASGGALTQEEGEAAIAATGILDPTSTVARQLRRREDVEGKSLGLATRIELLHAMLGEARSATSATAEEKLLSPRLLAAGLVAGVGLDGEEEENAEAARRQQRRLQRKWQQQAASRQAALDAVALRKRGGKRKAKSSSATDGASSDEEEGADNGSKQARVPAAGWEPGLKGRVTVDKARDRLLSEQLRRRTDEDARSGQRPKSRSSSARYVEWPRGAKGPRGEAIALPEAMLDDALADGRSSMRRAHRAVDSIREVQRSMPMKMKARLEHVKAELLETGQSMHSAAEAMAATVGSRTSALGLTRTTGAGGSPTLNDPTRTAPIPGVHKAWKSDGLLGAGERAALESLGTVPQVPTGREALRVLADELLGGSSRDISGMQHHEIQLELRSLLEERHNSKIKLGEATRLGRGLERVYYSKLITDRSLDEAL